MAAIDELKLPRLEENNYHAWSVRTKAALMQKNCWEAVQPGYSLPYTEAQNKTDQKALSFILLSVSDAYLEDIGDCQTAKEAWDTLENMHTKFGLLHTVLLLREMVNITKTDAISMHDYLSKIQDINRKVAKAGIEFPDNLLACFYLMGLPLNKYEGLVRNLEQEEVKLSTSTVKAKLLLEEKRIKREEPESEEKVLITRKKNYHGRKNYNTNATQVEGQQQDQKHVRVVYCFCCGGKGHIARNCKKAKHKRLCYMHHWKNEKKVFS